jgi:hypothetical protein
MWTFQNLKEECSPMNSLIGLTQLSESLITKMFQNIKLRKHASIWWEHLKKQRECERRSHIVTWTKMKKALKKKYLLDHYSQDVFLKFHNFRQNELSVEEYTAKFDHSMMRCDIVEPEEQMVARYLGGLRYEISNVVQLQPYWTYNDVCKLALKVEKQSSISAQGDK